MDYKKTQAVNNTVSRNVQNLSKDTGNVYESVMILAKRSNQIASELKEELNQKLAEFASYTDNLEEIFENREQIEISKFYERLPKPTLISIQEFIDGKIYYRNPSKDGRQSGF
ncbi:MAG: DNA-directed RNA polymerase subunit omega [Prolixibacteraceae bacterium]|nr:DNA-directed RNA polymerase subunit omega [Prolixibacteraceae bacterium]MBN2649156.1 DNA-directed RNA polymerase subunit omega [Prolixibacteraceae bacterium]